MKLRIANTTDALKIAHLHTDSWQRTYRGMLSDEFLDGDIIPFQEKKWTSVMANPADNQVVVIAEDGDQLAGFACAFLNHDAVYGTLIDNLHVDSRYRGQGVGTKLMLEVAKIVENRLNNNKFHLWVLEKNYPTRKFYENAGSKYIETELHLMPDGQNHASMRCFWDNFDELRAKLNQHKSLIEKAYSPDSFRNQAHQLVDLMADYLQSVQSQSEKTVIPFKNPAESLKYWQADFEKGIDENPLNFFQDVINRSTHLHHPRYMGHQVGVVTPLSAMSSLLTALLNNGMAVYEMGLVSNPLERIVTDLMAKRIGFNEKSNGLLTSGGTLANLTALLAARAKLTDVWASGNAEKLAVMVSEEAHYCIDRSARIMGMGSDGIIKVPTSENFEMQTELLEKYYDEANKKGLKVIAVIGSACSTSTGSYDNLLEIGRFAQKNNLWFHVDGAHGGAVVFSEKYKHLVKGIDLADSVVIDWHKMLLTPALATALIFRNGDDAYETFHQKAQYLWANQTSQDWFNSGKRTFECTKFMMSVKIYAMLKTYGEGIFAEYVDYTHDLAQKFAKMINSRPNFELAIEPKSNIVCFRIMAENNEINAQIRQKLLEEGKFYIVQTTIREKLYLRVSLMNPLTTEADLGALLDEIEVLKG